MRWGFALLLWTGAALAAWAIHDSRPGARGAARPLRPGDDLEAGPSASVPAPLADAGPGHAASGPPLGPRRGRLAWAFRTGGPITGPVATDARGVYVSSHDGHLYALDRAGRLRWRRALGAASYSGVAADGRGQLYVGTEDGALHGFAADGRPLFRLAGPGEGPADRVPVPVAGGPILFVRGRLLVSVSPRGRLGAHFAAHRKVFTRPAPSPHGPYLGAQDHHLYALDPRLRPRWSRDLGADVDGAPVLGPDAGVVVGADDGRVHAFDSHGKRRWIAQVGGAVRAPLALSPDGRVLVQAQGLSPALVCLRYTDGRVLWRHRLSLEDSRQAGSRSGPVVDAAGTAYLGSHDDRIVAVDPRGRLLFSHATGGQVHADAVLDRDGTLYVGADDGLLYALRD